MSSELRSPLRRTAIGATRMNDPLTRWGLMLLGLLGRPVPPVPALPGVVHECADAAGTPEEVAEALADGDADALGGLAGITTTHARRLIERRQAPGGPLDSGALTPQYR